MKEAEAANLVRVSMRGLQKYSYAHKMSCSMSEHSWASESIYTDLYFLGCLCHLPWESVRFGGLLGTSAHSLGEQ